ncbi:uncharacterized protein TNCV_4357801 [Trichonephila clavipes]|nr:uncharacterized protein TNCV_4357801 [Trichonephila clavipes]
MKIGNNGNLVLGPFDESTPCLMIVLMNCQTKLRINHLTAVKSVAILEKNWRENRNNERYANNSRPQREFNRFENQGFTNNRRFEGRRQGGQSDQQLHNQGSRQSGSRNSTFRGQNERNRHLNFLCDRYEYGGNRSRGTENPPVSDHRPIRVSSIRMTPVELPYVPILLNKTFITALRDTGAEKSFISEVYRKYFSYRPRQKTKDRVVTHKEPHVVT